MEMLFLFLSLLTVSIGQDCSLPSLLRDCNEPSLSTFCEDYPVFVECASTIGCAESGFAMQMAELAEQLSCVMKGSEPSITTYGGSIKIEGKEIHLQSMTSRTNATFIHDTLIDHTIKLEDLTESFVANVTASQSTMTKMMQCASQGKIFNGQDCVFMSTHLEVFNADEHCQSETDKGIVYASASSHNVVVCGSSGPEYFTRDRPGTSRDLPAKSCADLLNHHETEGFFYIEIPNATVSDRGRIPSEKVYCVNGVQKPWYPDFETFGEPILYMPFDRNFTDDVGSAPVSIVEGTPLYVEGRVGHAMDFAGSLKLQAYIPNTVWQGPFTVLVWVQIRDTGSGVDNAIIGHGSAVESRGLHLSERADGAYFGFYGNDVGFSLSLKEGEWHHLGFVYDGQGLKQIFIDGQLRSSGRGQPYIGNGITQIGGYPWWTDPGFDGLMDDLLIFDHAISERDISRFMHHYPTTAKSCQEVFDQMLPNSLYWFDRANDEPPVYCVGGTTAKSGPFRIVGFPLAFYPFNNNVDDEIGPFNLEIDDASALKFEQGVNGPAVHLENKHFFKLYSLGDWLWQGYFTVMAWIKVNDVSGGQALIGHGARGENQGLHLEVRGNRLHFGFYSNDLGGRTALVSNEWYHVAFVADGQGLMQIYLNGELDAEERKNRHYQGTGMNTEIGRYPWDTSRFFDGYVDELMIFDLILPATQIKAAYEFYDF